MGLFDNPELAGLATKVAQQMEKRKQKTIAIFCSKRNIATIIREIRVKLEQAFVSSGGIRPSGCYIELGPDHGVTLESYSIIVSSAQCRDAISSALQCIEPSIKGVALKPGAGFSSNYMTIEVYL